MAEDVKNMKDWRSRLDEQMGRLSEFPETYRADREADRRQMEQAREADRQAREKLEEKLDRVIAALEAKGT